MKNMSWGEKKGLFLPVTGSIDWRPGTIGEKTVFWLEEIVFSWLINQWEPGGNSLLVCHLICSLFLVSCSISLPIS